MNLKEVEALGFYYTGMSARSSEFEKEKLRAQELKKKYKGVDYRIVSERQHSRLGSEIWKSIYGNEAFHLVQYYNEDRIRYYINTYNDRVVALEKEYQQKLAALKEEQNKQIDLFEKIQEMKK